MNGNEDIRTSLIYNFGSSGDQIVDVKTRCEGRPGNPTDNKEEKAHSFFAPGKVKELNIKEKTSTFDKNCEISLGLDAILGHFAVISDMY